MGIPNLNEVLTNNPLAAQLGITSTGDNMLQFYNRMGSDNIIQNTPLATVIAKPYYFSVIWSFMPSHSFVKYRLENTIKESSTEAMKYFIQSIDLPDIESHAQVDTEFTEYGPVSNCGLYIKPSSNKVDFNFLSTEFSLHEHVFYFWLKETAANTWAYSSRPFTKVKCVITFFDSNTKSNMFSYVLTNMFPTMVETIKPNHATTDHLTRKVTFSFDNMFVLAAHKEEIGRLEKAFEKFAGDPLGRMMTTGLNRQIPTIPGI